MIHAPWPEAASPAIGKAEAALIVEIVRRRAGVSIDPGKRAFLELRVGRRLRETGCPDFPAYLRLLGGPGGEAEATHLVETLTTHTTAFFREKAHYDWLAAEGFPQRIAAGAGRDWPLTVWSAACSLGSEMWSAAMVLDGLRHDGHRGLRWEVQGTDVSRRVLRRAASAVFTEEELAGLPEDFRTRYLLRSQQPIRGRTLFRIIPELRRRARLSWANLVDDTRGPAIEADVVFLRNVLIYFEPDDQRRAVDFVTARLRPGGFLLTGHSESLAEAPRGLVPVAPSTYRKA